ncbi:MAG: c-type cytochrome [Candidatus Methylomirabilales bacterium]
MTDCNHRQRTRIIAVMVIVVGLAGGAWGQERQSGAGRGQPGAPTGRRLIENLGCVVCHTMEGHTTTVAKEAPDLTYEGDKVRPDWVFAFLMKPHSLRPWLNARMPSFQLSDREALALTEYIRQELRDKAAPPLPAALRSAGQVSKGLAAAGKELASQKYLDCVSCHMVGKKKPEGSREDWAPDLAKAAARLNPDWVVRWLLDPQKIQTGTRMPSYFAGRDSGPADVLGGDEHRQILALRAWLLGLGTASDLKGYATAKARYPHVSSGEGRRLMTELNCRGCHRVAALPKARKVAPVLSYTGTKFRREWLVAFLKKPHTIRAAGYILGWRSRMPDFRLSGQEVEAIADYLMTLTRPGRARGVVREGKRLSRLKTFQARKLFEKTKGCIGCHRIKKRQGKVVGGLSGPDLSAAGNRLQGDFMYHFIRDPRTFEPDGKMEIFGDLLAERDARTLAQYLSTLK